LNQDIKESDMQEMIVFWLNYIGGVNLLYVAAVSISGTQIFKMVSKSQGYDKPVVFRLVSYLCGALAGMEFIGGTQGPLLGLAVAGIASGAYYAATVWLKNSDKAWQQALAKHMSGVV